MFRDLPNWAEHHHQSDLRWILIGDPSEYLEFPEFVESKCVLVHWITQNIMQPRLYSPKPIIYAGNELSAHVEIILLIIFQRDIY